MFKRSGISPQYLRSDRIFVSIIEMKNPAHYIVKECSNMEPSPEVLKFIEADEMMQNYYKSVEFEFFQLPLKDAIVVVHIDRKFFRAQVRSILTTTDEYLFKVYLLDDGKECSVPRSCVFEIHSDFLKHPFQAVSFKLVNIEPISLVMNSHDLSLSYGPVDEWDTSSISFMETVLKTLSYAYIIVKGVEEDCLIGSLHINFCSSKTLCVNEELVLKKFAQHKQNGMENAQKLEEYMKSTAMKSSMKAEHCFSSSESVRSHHSLGSPNNTKNDDSHIETQTNDQKYYKKGHFSFEDINPNPDNRIICKPADKLRRKMTGCLAVDESKITNEIKTCDDKASSHKEPISYEKLMKPRHTSSPKSSDSKVTLSQSKTFSEVNETSGEMLSEVSKVKSLEYISDKVLSTNKLRTFLSSIKSTEKVSKNNSNEMMGDSSVRSPKKIHEKTSDTKQLLPVSPVKFEIDNISKKLSPTQHLLSLLNSKVSGTSVNKNESFLNENTVVMMPDCCSSSIEPNPTQKDLSNQHKEPNHFETNKQETSGECHIENIEPNPSQKDLSNQHKEPNLFETNKQETSGECHIENAASSPTQLFETSPKNKHTIFEANEQELATDFQLQKVDSKSPQKSVSLQKNILKEKVTPPVIFQKNSVKVDVLKKFLFSNKKLSESIIKSEDIPFPSQSTEKNMDFSVSKNTLVDNNDSENLHENKVDQNKSKKELENLIKEATSDAENPDVLESALDYEKKISSSDTETNSANKSRGQDEADMSLDFSGNNLWEKQKIPALCIGEAVPLPVLCVDETNFVPSVKKVLEDIRFCGPSSIQSIVWPAMNRLRNIAAIAPPHSGKTIAYLLPIISNLISGVFYDEVPKGKGPSVIILCSSWKKVQAVYDYFQMFGSSSKIKILTFFADGKSKKSKIYALVNGCEIVVAVPSCLLELLEEKAVDMSRCCHLIFDDGNSLLSRQMNDIRSLMLHILEELKLRPTLSVPLQILICAERWTKSVSSFVDKFMNNPLLLFTSFLESAIYAKVPIFGHVCPGNKKNKLLEILQKVQKTVVCTSSRENAMDIHNYLTCEGVRAYFVTEEMEHYIFDDVLKDWKSVQSLSVPYCLIITDAVLIDLPVTDANCLIHYDVPEISRLQFGNRFSCISNHFTKIDQSDQCVAHILISEECFSQSKSLLKIINRDTGKISKDLKHLINNVPEVLKSIEIPLCNYMKAYGACELLQCEFRHHINSSVDKPTIIPNEGDVQCLVTHVFDASHFYVKILRYTVSSEGKTHKSDSLSAIYAKIGFQLKKIYACEENKKKVTSPVVGENYIFEENSLFYRVKVLRISESSQYSSKELILAFQDEGWVKTYKNWKLYHLVNDVELPPPLSAEVYLCGVSPADTCPDWNYQATHFIHNMIYGKEIHGKIVLCLRDTLWLHPIMLREKLLFANNYVNQLTLATALKENGFAAENCQHLSLLHKACEGEIAFHKVAESPDPNRNVEIEQVEISHAFLDLDMNEDVYVSAIVSPHQFYVQREKFTDCLDSLLDEINDQIEKKLLKKCKVPQKGLHCIAPFPEDNRYYRAVIVNFNPENDEVHLFYVDFGDTARCKSNSIYILPPQFLLLPFQAIECELDGISPAHGGWSDKVIDSFYNLTRDSVGDMKILQLQAYTKSLSYSGGNHYIVDLWDCEKSLSDQLLETGLVIVSDKANVEKPSIAQQKDIWDDVPEGYIISSDEDLSADEKNNRALFCAVLAKMMLQGEKPSIEEINEMDKCLKENSENNLNADINVKMEGNLSTTKKDQEEKISLETVHKVPTCLKENKKNQMNSDAHVSIKNNRLTLKKEFPCNKNEPLSPFHRLQKLLKSTKHHHLKSARPYIKWWDSKDKLNVMILVSNLKIYEFDLQESGFKFKTTVNNVEYCCEEIFFTKVSLENRKITVTPEGLQIILSKTESLKWPRLIKGSLKSPYIKYDVNHIEDSDSEDFPIDTCNINISKSTVSKVEGGAPHFSDEDEEDTESTDEEETYVKPWRDLATYKDPFNIFT